MYSDIEDMKVTKQYDHQKIHSILMEMETSLLLRPGTFMISMPHDVHAPGFCVSEPEYVKNSDEGINLTYIIIQILLLIKACNLVFCCSIGEVIFIYV